MRNNLVRNISIVQATVEDASSILELQKLAYQSEASVYDDFSIAPLTQTLDEIKSDFADNVFLKVQVGGKTIGSIKAHQRDDICFIERLIVHPDFQGQGIGSALMTQIELYFRGARRFELFTGHKSQRNIRLYERLGYKIFKTQVINKNLTFVFLNKYKEKSATSSTRCASQRT